ncbi:MAG: hypothetical protein DRQ02_01370 [Candidatus Latescibacterota bacterium]|nr:MAG: hypothetical protein DRQ02_01370 [Candidatus Latescibacterota bacterium]
MKPQRIQRKRNRGWRMPANTIYVGRPTRWGNPFHVGMQGNAAECVRLYRSWLRTMPILVADAKRELRGKNLACWCSLDQPCHADVLLELVKDAP